MQYYIQWFTASQSIQLCGDSPLVHHRKVLNAILCKSGERGDRGEWLFYVGDRE